jgi:hypothetical protein
MTSLPQRNDAKTCPTTPFSAPWLDRLRKALGEIEGRPVLMSGHAVTEAQRAEISREIGRLRSHISPSSGDRREKAVVLAKLFAAFHAQLQSDVPADVRMAAYFEALRDAPTWAVEAARVAIIDGKTALSPTFAPTPPELAGVVRLVMQPARKDLSDLEKIAAARSIEAARSDEERRRVEGGFERLRADLVTPREPVSAE